MKVLFGAKRWVMDDHWPNWMRWERDFWRVLMWRRDSTRVTSWARRSSGDGDADARRGVVDSKRVTRGGRSFIVG